MSIITRVCQTGMTTYKECFAIFGVELYVYFLILTLSVAIWGAVFYKKGIKEGIIAGSLTFITIMLLRIFWQGFINY